MTDRARPLTPRWNALIVVCKDCAKRDQGPKHLSTKDAVRALRDGLQQARSGARVVKAGCVGICPRRAITVTHLGPSGGPEVVAIDSADQALAFARQRPR